MKISPNSQSGNFVWNHKKQNIKVVFLENLQYVHGNNAITLSNECEVFTRSKIWQLCFISWMEKYQGLSIKEHMKSTSEQSYNFVTRKWKFQPNAQWI